jgi:hypothetical protein
MVALMIWIGVQPSVFLRRMEPSVEHVLEHVRANGLQAGADQDDEAVVTFTSTNPLETEDEGLEPTTSLPGDEE